MTALTGSTPGLDMGAASGGAVTPEAPAAASPTERLAWLDAAKGVGIVLVALGHAMGGLMDVAGGPPLPVLQSVFFVIYTFHMPLFFFLSAALVKRRIERSQARFFESIWTRIAVPYVLWSTVQFTLIYCAGSLVNSPVDSYWPTIAALPWQPVSQFWFLYVLALLQLISLITLSFAPRHGVWILLGAAVILRVVACFVPGPGPLGQVMVFGVYFAAGLALGAPAIGVLTRLRRWSLVSLAIAAALSVILAYQFLFVPLLAGMADPSSPTLAGSGWGAAAIPAAVLGTMLTIAVAARFPQPLMAFAVRLGEASMAIYLTHVIVIAGTRIAIQQFFGPTDPLVLAPILAAIGIAVGLAIRSITGQWRIARWAGLQ